jgi:parallel beta-helix repeat protein
MERKHTKRLLILLTTVLFLSITFFVPGINGVTPQKNTVQDPVIVEDISRGTTTIQDAIDCAQPNSTIHLPAGTYTEILTINKPLHLKGEGTTRTFVSPTSANNGYALRIIAKGVTLSDLDITNKGPGLYTTGVKISASNTTIQNCTFHDTPIGIAIWSSENTISSCEFSGCDDEGLVLLGTSTTACTNNTISSCDFYENCDGIELQYATDNTIDSCTFIQNTHAGIDAIESNNNNNIISHCEFTANQGFGLYLAGSSHNMITGCSFVDDSITLLHASETIISNSEVSIVRLMDHSSLFLKQCKGIDESAIISQQSSYTIDNTVSTQESLITTNNESARHPLRTLLLDRLTEIRSFYRLLRQQ